MVFDHYDVIWKNREHNLPMSFYFQNSHLKVEKSSWSILNMFVRARSRLVFSASPAYRHFFLSRLIILKLLPSTVIFSKSVQNLWSFKSSLVWCLNLEAVTVWTNSLTLSALIAIVKANELRVKDYIKRCYCAFTSYPWIFSYCNHELNLSE